MENRPAFLAAKVNMPLTIHNDLIYLDLKITPNASKTEAVGVADNRLRIKVAAPPQDGKANAALIAFLSKETKCPKRDIAIKNGAAGRLKTITLPAAYKEAAEKLV